MAGPSGGPLRIATRGSALARWQAERVAALLRERSGATSELVIVETTGDRDLTSPIHAIGGTGVFVKEVQEAVRRGEADLAVHSAKDLPAITPDGLVLGAFPERADVRDALVGSTLDRLGPGATVATGSVRRRVQLAALRPDLSFVELRGNMATRLAKAADVDAVVVAAAALDRLGLADRIAERLEPDVLLPQVAQGALAVECRSDDETALHALAEIDDPVVHRAVAAERAFLGALGGGCELPVGALARLDGSTVHLEALLATGDATRARRTRGTGDDPETLGRRLAAELMETDRP